jgi:glycosyltransferase involved in cell wall biosynthesis
MNAPLTVISPYTHLAGHYWPYTVDTAAALTNVGVGVSIYAALPPRDAGQVNSQLITWKSCAPWTPLLKSVEKRNLRWGSRSDNMLRNLEFALCLKRALLSPESTHIHCIESRHQLLLNAVLRSDRSFSTLCVGSPTPESTRKLGTMFQQAFATGRLRFIVETEAVRADWEGLAGNNVVHIPAALTERTEPVLSKQQARQQLGLPQDAFIPLFFGTHREGKDYRTAIEAAKLSKTYPFLLFAGPLISGNDPEVLLKELGYDNAISRNRVFYGEEISEFFDACDVVMLPYARGYEKGSAVLLQACKYGRPVIASNTGHLASFVNQHETGLLFEPENPESLANVYDQLARAQQVDADVIKLNIASARQEYSWKKLVERYLDIFDDTEG